MVKTEVPGKNTIKTTYNS